jgi:hypothetical protein
MVSVIFLQHQEHLLKKQIALIGYDWNHCDLKMCLVSFLCEQGPNGSLDEGVT